MNDFQKNKFTIIKKAISTELAEFIYNYFILKRKVAHTLYTSNFLETNSSIFGHWNDKQVLNTYSHYSDIAMETLLVKLHPKMEEQTGLTLFMNYSYARLYLNGDELKKHKDRFACEISTTLRLGGDPWTIYLQTKENEAQGINLNIGDMLVYKGNELEHWREPFEGEQCGQVFLHYTDVNTKDAEKNKFDTRPHLGLPDEFTSD